MATHNNMSFMFQFEKQLNLRLFADYMSRHQYDSFIYTAAYTLLVFSIKKWMENRPGYELRPYLVIWNVSIGIFSVFGAVRVVPELIYSAKFEKEYSLCSLLNTEGVTEFWSFLFVFSKVLELGDTVFIVLRKRKLIFLHWYHHVTVLLYVWYFSLEAVGFTKWLIGINYTVHAIMYNYYALRAMKFHIPKIIRMLITAMQLSQMVCGFVIICMAYQLSLTGVICGNSNQIIYGLIVYGSYFVLFGNFFYQTYVVEKPKLRTIETSDRKKKS